MGKDRIVINGGVHGDECMIGHGYDRFPALNAAGCSESSHFHSFELMVDEIVLLELLVERHGCVFEELVVLKFPFFEVVDVDEILDGE